MDPPLRRDQAPARAVPTPPPGAAPIAILDFLASAEAVVERLTQHTCVPDWVLVRRLGEEWVVLAGRDARGFRPGDVLDRPTGAPEHLTALASMWVDDVVVDLTDGQAAPSPSGAVALPGPEQLDGLVAYPLWSSDGLFGAVCALPGDAEVAAELRRTEPMVRLTVELLTSVLGLDLDRSRLQRRLDAAESAALSDPLTGLGNRRAFERTVDREEARCARFGHRAGIMVLDIDGLKDVNDTAGHAVGDDLLRRAGEAIRRTLRSADQAFRIGGDEFALLLPEVTADGLRGLHDRLADALSGVDVSASIGCAIREHAGDLRACVQAADAEMYERKRHRVTGRRRSAR